MGTLRSRHQRTLERIFTRPTPSDIRWSEVVSLMRALDVEISELAGSRVLLRKSSVRVVVHRPHPGPNLKPSSVQTVARFLDQLGAGS
ncbi:MAG: type II toxin-antitoxin system HicA family toxin [Chloroflexi bacterium]|nr:type II toxin-antitoxin system HicA family toxin [Chloroflexota bacterium]